MADDLFARLEGVLRQFTNTPAVHGITPEHRFKPDASPFQLLGELCDAFGVCEDEGCPHFGTPHGHLDRAKMTAVFIGRDPIPDDKVPLRELLARKHELRPYQFGPRDPHWGGKPIPEAEVHARRIAERAQGGFAPALTRCTCPGKCLVHGD